jgi:trehalose 6-phosphate synthase
MPSSDSPAADHPAGDDLAGDGLNRDGLAAEFSFVVVSNRLPVDRVVDDAGEPSFRSSPGGLVTALEPVMQQADGAWIGWTGQADDHVEPFEHDGIHLIPVALSESEVELYYEGFSNDTLWPLYHDVIAPPAYHREWWDSYVTVNQRFADRAADVTAPGGIVWVQDYQLQLVPKMLRTLRPDLTIGFFNHIPFPAYGIYSQLPWRSQIIEGLLGADVIGFQRTADAGNFTRAVRRLTGFQTKGTVIDVPVEAESEVASAKHRISKVQGSRLRGDTLVRTVVAKAFPISIDAARYEELARRPDIQARAKEIREGLGNPSIVMLGVDRLDYTKGIGHRLKAFGELLADGDLDVEAVTLVQVASPSRERVRTYQMLRDEIELTVGRINGDYSTISHTAISYLHHGYPREEMVALYLAADVMLVTALRDGMNLVAKEYVASRFDNDGVLVLSEFAGASDELRTALRVNPHDIEGLKESMLAASKMPRAERARRMRAMRKRVQEYDVARWSSSFLAALTTPSNGLALPKANLPEQDRAEQTRTEARAEERADERAREESSGEDRGGR